MIRKGKKKGFLKMWWHKIKRKKSNPFSILILLSFNSMFAYYGGIWSNPGRCLNGFFCKWPKILVIFENFSSVWVWFGSLRKLNVCLNSNLWEKGFFDRNFFFWLIVFVCKFFFPDSVGFCWCKVCCNLCIGWTKCCVRGGFLMGPFCDINTVFNSLRCGLYDWY